MNDVEKSLAELIETHLSRAPHAAESVTLPGDEFAAILEAAATTTTRVAIGSFVRQKVPNGRAKERFAYGRLCAIDAYRDDHGVRQWLYVRWINADGKPESEPMKHHADELEPYP